MMSKMKKIYFCVFLVLLFFKKKPTQSLKKSGEADLNHRPMDSCVLRTLQSTALPLSYPRHAQRMCWDSD